MELVVDMSGGGSELESVGSGDILVLLNLSVDNLSFSVDLKFDGVVNFFN